MTPLNRRKIGPIVLGLALTLACFGAAARAQKPLKVLLVLVGATGAGNSAHNIETNPPYLEKVLETAGGVEVSRLAPAAGQSGAAHLAKLAELKPGDYDVLVFYTVGQQLSPEQNTALQAFVEAGGGVVAIHGASASFRNSETWFRMIGARFTGHAPGTYTLPIAVSDPSHPITRGVRDFEIVDEEYTHQFPEGVTRNVLVKFKQRPPNTSEKNGNNDAVWTIGIGKGRAVYNCLGHGEEAWKNSAWLKLTAQSIFWAAGKPREVKTGG